MLITQGETNLECPSCFCFLRNATFEDKSIKHLYLSHMMFKYNFAFKLQTFFLNPWENKTFGSP